jgi:hypothetical protein
MNSLHGLATRWTPLPSASSTPTRTEAHFLNKLGGAALTTNSIALVAAKSVRQSRQWELCL